MKNCTFRGTRPILANGPAVRALAAALIWLFTFAATPVQQDVWTGVERVVAVGDVHGDYVNFVALLQKAGIVDRKANWIGGKSHLVQLGDVVDRGAESRKVMDLLMKLGRQSERAGGRVHTLIGNHDAMNVYGDLRYVSAGEFDAFRTSRSEELRNALYERHVESLKRNPPAEGLPLFDRAYREQWNSGMPLGFVEHRLAFAPNGKYGKWIRGLNAMIKIDDTLFVHAGLSPKYAEATIQAINAEVRKGLDGSTDQERGAASDPEGPLWYRGLATGDETALAGHVDGLLKKHGIARIAIGHTVVDGAVMPRFGGKVVAVDAGLGELYGARSACLLIEHGVPFALHRGTKLALPDESVPSLLRYLKTAAGLDPPPSPLEKRILELENQVH
jgi:hypothetical protein